MKNFVNLSSAQDYYRDEMLIDDEDAFSCLSQEHDTNVVTNSVYAIEVEDYIIIGCLQYDSNPTDFWDDENSPLTLFTKQNYTQTMKEAKKGGKLYYLVDKYEHGNVNYSVSATVNYPDKQFDVSYGCGVYVPYDHVQKQYKKMKKEVGESEAFTHFVDSANQVLSSYSDWCNGEVYGYNVVVYDKQGQAMNEDNQCWGYIGYDSVQKEMLDVMHSLQQNALCEKLAKNVVTEEKTIEDLKALKLKVDTNDLTNIHYTHVYDKHIVAINYALEDKAIVYEFTEGVKKPKISQFGQWQVKHQVAKEDFLQSRTHSSVIETIRQHIQDQNKKNDLTL